VLRVEFVGVFIMLLVVVNGLDGDGDHGAFGDSEFFGFVIIILYAHPFQPFKCRKLAENLLDDHVQISQAIQLIIIYVLLITLGEQLGIDFFS